ncbi:activating signal cointegrator 1 complex subunit 2 homolog [Schistocerca serialis cubense]|uniref:activating signal cointegrator 1 complex subunit 2 homolog n=1 Tax=Schistocerca serialis cubense TaxID=2023355 RepID=UPI00214E7EBB|nr:activating signal cointegrator 1 complex subunit 2 homolog [Schistocerca serialis cubense]
MVCNHLIQAAPNAGFRRDALRVDDPTLDQVIDQAFKYEVSTAANKRLESWAEVAALRDHDASEPVASLAEVEDVAAVRCDDRRRPSCSAQRRQGSRPVQEFAPSDCSGGPAQTVSARRPPRSHQRREPLLLPSCPECFKNYAREYCPDSQPASQPSRAAAVQQQQQQQQQQQRWSRSRSRPAAAVPPAAASQPASQPASLLWQQQQQQQRYKLQLCSEAAGRAVAVVEGSNTAASIKPHRCGGC